MTTNEIEEIKQKINDFIYRDLSHQGLIDFIFAYGEKCREKEREKIIDVIENFDATIAYQSEYDMIIDKLVKNINSNH